MRKPTSPGEILRDEFLVEFGLTQKKLAEHLGVDIKTVNRIINERSPVTPEIALKLSASFGTTAQFWLNAQMALDLYNAKQEISDLPKKIKRAS